MRRKLYRVTTIITILVTLMTLVAMTPALTYAEPNIIEVVSDNDLSVEPIVRSEEYVRQLTYHSVDAPVPIMENSNAIYANRGTLPAAYSSLSGGKLPSLKEQGSYGTCWAFSAIGASEASLIAQGKATTAIDLSERHLAYFFYNKGVTADVLGGTVGDYNTALTDDYMSQGGNSLFTMWHLASWAGLVPESVAPYEGIETALSNSTESVYGSDTYHLQNAYIINKENTDIVKQAIIDYGALATAYYSSSSAAYDCTMDDDYGCYYYPIETNATNHAIQIVGWDDSFSASNFATTPEDDGAWLVKNSWGEEVSGEAYAQNGYFWISYYDKGLDDNFIAFICESADNYDNIYQYDGASGNDTYGIKHAANIFEAKANDGGYETIEAVGIGNFSNGVNYTLQIYTDLTDDSDPTSGTKVLEQTGNLAYSGYNTVPLNEAVTIADGEKFSVVWLFQRQTYLYVDDTYQNGDWIYFTTEETANTSFYKISASTDWNEASTEDAMTFRIKAYTNNATDVQIPLQSIAMNCTSVSLEIGGSTNLSVTYNPVNTTADKTVVWNSSNSAVATVSNGKVIAKKAGTTVITAVCGNVKATCTITVKESRFSIQNQNNSAGTFTVRIARINEQSSIRGISVAVWNPINGQDDLKWYSATPIGNGVYTVNVNIANHGGLAGNYVCHAYAEYSNGTSACYATGSVSFTKEIPKSSGISAVVASNENTVTLQLKGVSGVNKVEFAVWSNNKGQDDLVWYTAANQGDGVWSVTVPLSAHQYMAGTYSVHAYAGNVYQKDVYMRATSFQLKNPQIGSVTVSNVNSNVGSFRINVGSIYAKAGVDVVEVAVWSKGDQSNLKWYTATRQSDGTYTVNVNLANHGYEYGTYQIHAYLYDQNGIWAVKGTRVAMTQPVTSLIMTGNSTQTQYNIKAINVGYAGGVKGAEVAVWSTTGGQDDLIWYDMTNHGNGTWSVNVPVAAHKGTGTYQAHVYIMDQNGNYHFMKSGSFTVDSPVIGNVVASNINHSAGTCKVTLSGIQAKAGVDSIEVAVWSKSDQSNLKWYTATRQSDGTYVVNVDLSNHKYEYGLYSVHAYLYDGNGNWAIKGTSVRFIQPTTSALVTGNSAQSYYNIKALNVDYAGGVSAVEVAVWSNTGGQDDLIWYNMTNQGNGVWSTNVPITNHRTLGKYSAHIYVCDRNGNAHIATGTSFNVTKRTW